LATSLKPACGNWQLQLDGRGSGHGQKYKKLDVPKRQRLKMNCYDPERKKEEMVSQNTDEWVSIMKAE